MLISGFTRLASPNLDDASDAEYIVAVSKTDNHADAVSCGNWTTVADSGILNRTVKGKAPGIDVGKGSCK